MDDYRVGAMDAEKPWVVTYTYHDRNECFHVENVTVMDSCMGSVLHRINETLVEREEVEGWSDWIITNISLIREVH